MSEWAKVNVKVRISSHNGWRKDTFFGVGNMGFADLLRMGLGKELLVRMDW